MKHLAIVFTTLSLLFSFNVASACACNDAKDGKACAEHHKDCKECGKDGKSCKHGKDCKKGCECGEHGKGAKSCHGDAAATDKKDASADAKAPETTKEKDAKH